MIAFLFAAPYRALALVLACHTACADEHISLISPDDPASNWAFNNGREFPGATGSLETDAGASREECPSLKLTGDFTKGGGYVQAGRQFDPVDIRELSFWTRCEGTDQFTLRLGDSSGQTHQFKLKLDPSPGWQRVTLPVRRFFARRGQADALTNILKYESWGGAKDGNWHGPATAVYLLLSKGDENSVRTLWLNDVAILPEPAPVAGAELAETVALDEIVEGVHDWKFSLGNEFPGARGSLTVAENLPESGQFCLRLEGDFTGGGAYVAAIRNLDDGSAADTTAFRARVKTDNVTNVTIQIVDGSGQTHQRKHVPIIADGKWNDLSLIPAEIAGGEHWGGANDGKWHGPARSFVLSLTSDSDPEKKRPDLLLSNVRADILRPVFAQAPAFSESFDGKTLADSWTATGGVTLKSGNLVVSRSPEKINEPREAVGPAFAATPGRWKIETSIQTDLKSPDNSYRALVTVEALDSTGQTRETFTVADLFGKTDPARIETIADFSEKTRSARFRIRQEKAEGEFRIGHLSAVFLAPPLRQENRVERLLFSTAQLGNLLFPEDPREISLTVEARKPLPIDQRGVTCVVRDYWGSEQTEPARVELSGPEKSGDRFVYRGTLDLAEAPLETGRYYEIHASMAAKDSEPFTHSTSLAILPAAATHQYAPEEVPFTARNWDNRIPEYIRLTNRLGIRICGLWGRWSPKPPYKASVPGLDLVKELGMGWLTTTACTSIEDGKDEYDENALRQGVRNLIETFGQHRPLIINLGNEPHGTGGQVRKNVAAYRAVYEEIKSVDPSIKVVATSVEPNEEYHAAGYGQWCDAYDFHIYEDSANVRRTIEEYQKLAERYGHPKPIWSTELGLNSQGLPRHTVAVELIRKFAAFFAAGGENVSWFGLLYPDPSGKSFGSSGDSHNVFDCRFNRYCPRLDAVAYYHAVNAIAIKRFVEEKCYAGGISAFLFRDRDGRRLQILWKDPGREDVFVPLENVDEVRVIRIDGSSRILRPRGKGITVTVSRDPLLLLYENGPETLANSLGTPAASLAELPETVSGRDVTEFSVRSAHELALIAPPFWKVEKSEPESGLFRFRVSPPEETAAREIDLAIRVSDGTGELFHRFPIAN